MNNSWTGKLIGAIRIILGIAMIYFGVMKIGASPEMMAMIGGAAHKFGLTFLSTTVRFWIATLGEILAGVLLVFGCTARWGAILTLIIMVFAWNFMGWMWNLNAGLVTIGALIILWQGAGDWRLCSMMGCKCCMGDKSM